MLIEGLVGFCQEDSMHLICGVRIITQFYGIHNLLLQNLNPVSPLSQHQYGFTAGIDRLLQPYSPSPTAALDSGDKVCSVIFDLCKAFDKVLHLLLLHKLADLQVNPCSLRWIGSYLLDSLQAVVQSSPLHVISGVASYSFQICSFCAVHCISVPVLVRQGPPENQLLAEEASC